ncbi:MAG TPA: hypothetical protein VFF21_05740 [Flavobacteriaceae bacterium]|nr:hypothetical protein [Flavobacteriaceae bacterium]
MKYVINILFLVALGGLVAGFVIQPGDKALGDKFIGLSMILGFFIVMPLFIYHRWKGKDISKYYLNHENIMKMREYREAQDRPKKGK